MLITVTCNPAMDKTARVDCLAPRTMNRLRAVRQDPGGKGVNVSRTVAAMGGRSLACGFVAGQTGRTLLAALEEEGIEHEFVSIPGETRINLKLVEPKGALTELNEPGPLVSLGQVKQLTEVLERYAAPDTLFVLAGSLCPGMPAKLYADWVAQLKAKGAKVLLDAGGPVLATALQAPVKPDLIKPNLYELAEYFSVPVDRADEVALARELLKQGVGAVCVSLGNRGAALFTNHGSWRCAALPVPVQSTVGAGDAMVAGLAWGVEQGWQMWEAFRLSMAAASAACVTPGTQPPDRKLVETLVSVVRLERI